MAFSLSRWVEMKEDFWSEDMDARFGKKVAGMLAACADAGTERDVPDADETAPAERAAPAAEESMFRTPPGPLAVTEGAADVRAAGMAKRESKSVA